MPKPLFPIKAPNTQLLDRMAQKSSSRLAHIGTNLGNGKRGAFLATCHTSTASSPAVRRLEIDDRIDRNDMVRVDGGMAPMIMTYDMVQMNRPGDSLFLIKLPRITP